MNFKPNEDYDVKFAILANLADKTNPWFGNSLATPVVAEYVDEKTFIYFGLGAVLIKADSSSSTWEDSGYLPYSVVIPYIDESDVLIENGNWGTLASIDDLGSFADLAGWCLSGITDSMEFMEDVTRRVRNVLCLIVANSGGGKSTYYVVNAGAGTIDDPLFYLKVKGKAIKKVVDSRYIVL